MKRKIYASRSNELLSWVNKEYLLKRFPLKQVNFNFGLSEGGGELHGMGISFLQMIMWIVKFITELTDLSAVPSTVEKAIREAVKKNFFRNIS